MECHCEITDMNDNSNDDDSDSNSNNNNNNAGPADHPLTLERISSIRMSLSLGAPVLDDSEGYHEYVSKSNDRYQSVTTMLGRTKPAKDRASLQRWKDGEPAHDYIARNAARIGTESHALIEDFLRKQHGSGGRPAEKLPRPSLLAKAHLDNLKPYLQKITDVIATEQPLKSDTMRLAGTADCIARYDGVLSIIDFKTKRSEQRAAYMTDYFIQTACYARMFGEMTGQKITQGVILASTEANTRHHYVISTAAYEDDLDRRLDLYRGQRDT